MEIQVNEITKIQFDKRDTRVLKKEFGAIATDIANVLKQRMTKQDGIFLGKCLKNMQKYTPLSLDFIRYILLTEEMNHSDAIASINSGRGRGIVKKQMRKLYKFLKERHVVIDIRMRYYSRLTKWNNNIIKILLGRTIRRFRL